MAKITIGFAVALIVVGIVGYVPSGQKTALIPAIAGVVIGTCGAIALNPAARKHAMHAAVMVGMLGFLASAGRLVGALMSGNLPSGLGLFSLGAMALLTFIFVLLCVRSFIGARRQAEQRGFEVI